MLKGKSNLRILAIIIGILSALACVLSIGTSTSKRNTSLALPSQVPVLLGTVQQTATKYTYDTTTGKTPHYSYGADYSNSANFKETAEGLQSVNSGDYVVLNNYAAQQKLLNSTSSDIEVLYLGIGGKWMDDNWTKDYAVTSLQVDAWLSNNYVHNTYGPDNNKPEYTFYDRDLGVRIVTYNTRASTFKDDGGNDIINYYWFQYFDGTDTQALLDANTNNTDYIPDGQGLYTINISGMLSVWNGHRWVAQSFTDTIQFYLLEENSYVDYPVINAEYAGKNNADYGTYYYNYQTQTLPTMVYNATTYDVDYTYSYSTSHIAYNNTFQIVGAGTDNEYGLMTISDGTNTSSVRIKIDKTNNRIDYYLNDDENPYAYITIDADGIFRLYYYSGEHFDVRQNGQVIKNGAKNTPLDYYYFIQLEDVATYNFTIRYVVGLNASDFVTVNEVPLNTLKNYQITDGANTYYGLNILQHSAYNNGIIKFDNELMAIEESDTANYDQSPDGQVNLRLFGVKPNFYKTINGNSTKLWLQDKVNGIYADQTINIANVNNYTPSNDNKFSNIPLTNLQPIYFDYLGTYLFDATNNNSPMSRVYRYTRGQYKVEDKVVDGTKNTVYTIISDTPTESGFIKDSSISQDGLYVVVMKYNYALYPNPNQQFTQVFAFEINNTAPKLTVNVGDDTGMSVQPSTSAYTNKQYVSATWREPNYFEGDIYATVKYYPYTDSGVSTDGQDIPCTKDEYINVVDGKTREGKYVITLHYAYNGESMRDYVIHVDRMDINYTMYLVNSNTDDHGTTTYTKGAQLEHNISNVPFMLTHGGVKPSGAQISVKYQMIPLAIHADWASIDKKYKLNDDSVLTRYFINGNDSVVDTTSNYLYQKDDEKSSIRRELVLGAMGSAIYALTLTDEAGNETTVYYMYDATLPYSALLDKDNNEIKLDNDYGQVNAQTTVFFGDYKAIQINGVDLSAMNISGDNWRNAKIETIGGIKYLLIPLNGTNKAVVEANGKPATITASYVKSFTIYKNDKTAQNQSGWNYYGENSLDYFAGEKTYSYTLTDILGNHIKQSITMNLDKAQLMPFITMRNKQGEDSGEPKGDGYKYNTGKAYNANKLQLQYQTNIALGESGDTIMGVDVTYSYYPFAFEDYLDANLEEFPIYEGTIDTKYNQPKPTYPFSMVATKTASTEIDPTKVDGNKVTTKALNLISGNTAQGMYVIKRMYTGVNEDDFKLAEEDDAYIRYYVIYVDRNGIMQLVYSLTCGVDNINSVGDAINLVLGAGTNEGYMTTIDAETLLSLMSITPDADSALFNTNKVQVAINTPADKYATAHKLSGKYTDATASTNINAAADYNKNVFPINIDLYYLENGATTPTYLIQGNAINVSSITDIRNILLHEEHTYTLVLYDNSGIVEKDESTGDETLNVGHAEQKITFRVSYERPSGSYNSVFTNDGDKIKPISIKESDDTLGQVTFNSINDQVLQFTYSDSTDAWKATVDTGYLLVESKVGAPNNGGAWSTALQIDGGVTTTNISSANVEDILTKEQIGTMDGNDLYRYVLTLFDARKANNLVDGTLDRSYRVTLRFAGEQDYYTRVGGGNYYTNSFVIYVDRVNPENNLNALIASDKVYDGQSLDSYYLAVNNGARATVFDGSNRNDSAEVYIRSLGTEYPTHYRPTLVNGESGESDRPVFDVYNSLYTRYNYDTANKLSFAGMADGYYEIIERDEAGNCTRYAVFVSNNDERNMRAKITDTAHMSKYVDMIAGASADESIKCFSIDEFSYNEIESNGQPIDQYSVANIIANGNILRTLYSDPASGDIAEWWNDVIAALNEVSGANPEIFDYTVEFVNRFGGNYYISISLPGNKLELTIVTTNEQMKVTVPAKRNNVNIDHFEVWKYDPEEKNESEKWKYQTNDLDKTIVINDDNRTDAIMYVFGAGQYKLVTIDNYGRRQEYYEVVGGDSSAEYTFNYGSKWIVRDNITYTSSDVTLNIDENLWKVNTNTIEGSCVPTYNSITKRTTYTFSHTASIGAERFEIALTWATASDSSATTFVFVIDNTAPTATLTDINGKRLNIQENNNENITYTRDFYINYNQGDYGVVATLERNGNTASTINSGYFVNEPGQYLLRLTNGIGKQTTYKFTRSDNTYSFYSVSFNDELLAPSTYTTTMNNRSVHHYFVLGTSADVDKISIVVDTTEGYNHNKTPNGDEYVEYEVTNGTAVICYIRINWIAATNKFNSINVTVGSSGTPTIVNTNIIRTTVDQVTLTLGCYNGPAGNNIMMRYYYNNAFVTTLMGEDANWSFTATRAGLHSFEVYDLAGNKHLWGDSERLDVLLLNDVVYTVNGETPIPNQIFNDKVTINLITALGGYPLYTSNVTVSATHNGKETQVKVTNNKFEFETNGYYTVTMTATINDGAIDQSISTTYTFAIVHTDVAYLSYSIPSSYQFTIRKVMLNNADITDKFEDKSTMWLSVGDTGSGLYTVTLSYYSPQTLSDKNFTFKVWINEEVPTIVPVNYTYGTKTSKDVVLSYNAKLIYDQIGNSRVVLTRDGEVVYNDTVSASSADGLSYVTISTNGKSTAGTYIMSIYNAQDQLVVSYKIIKTVPLNTAAKIIIVVASVLVVMGTIVFIVLRRHTKFR